MSVTGAPVARSLAGLPRQRPGPLDRLTAGVRGVDRERPAVGTGKIERVMDPSPADRRWRQALLGIVAVRRVDIIDHQVERRSGPGLRRLLGVSDDDVRTAA